MWSQRQWGKGTARLAAGGDKDRQAERRKQRQRKRALCRDREWRGRGRQPAKIRSERDKERQLRAENREQRDDLLKASGFERALKQKLCNFFFSFSE